MLIIEASTGNKMSLTPNKNTYAGQFANKKRRKEGMNNNNKQRLRTLHVQLGTLMTQKKALNSKITTRDFDLFKEAVEEGADPHEIKSRLNRLEQSLKQEGLFKNVKSDFVPIKKEILGSLNWTDGSQIQHKSALPGITARDRTFHVPPKHAADNDLLIAPLPTTTQKHASSLATDDMRVLNSAIGKLYRHLQLNPKEQDGAKTEIIFKEDTSHTENINILTISSVQPDETFHDIVLKIKIFEKEFQRQRVQQQRELKRLQEEIKRLNKNSTELRKENERIKGVQPIVTKAKGKQVEKLEERYRTEKRGMEEKIHELEDGMKRNLAHLLHDKDENRSQMRLDVDSLVSAINNVHLMVTGHYHDMTAINRNTDNGDILPTKDILAMLTNVAGGVQLLKSKTTELSNETEQLSTWQQCLWDVEKDITRFNRAFNDEDKEKTSIPYHDNDPHSILTSCRTKLQKSKDKINAKLKAAADTTSLFKRKERDMTNLRRNMDVLRAEITKLHEHVISVQMQDISISMPTFERRNDPGERSDGSTDELPEADRQDHGDMVEKLKQVGTMVSHFQQLIIDRTSILTKMENDMLPLKIRVNRLHEEITKSMNNNASPEHDLADDILRSRRTISPEEPANVFSREINNMLTKLSKMELAIRHLLETFATSNGRASI